MSKKPCPPGPETLVIQDMDIFLPGPPGGMALHMRLPGAITIYLCPNCDKTHLCVQAGESVVLGIALTEKNAEKLARKLIQPDLLPADED